MNPSPPKPTFEELIELASRHRPAVAERPGFETRLRARIAELRRDSAAGLFVEWLWRATLGLAPVAIALALTLFLTHGFGLPADAESALSHLAAWIPGIL